LGYTISDTLGGDNVDWQSEEDKKRSQANLEEMRKHDLSDWLLTIRRRDEDWYPEDESESRKRLDAQRKEFDKHAIDKWKSTRSIPWLVAAMWLNGFESADMQGVSEAAINVPEQSPVYLTANYFVIDALIAQKKVAQAQERISKTLAHKDLHPHAPN